MGAVEGELKLIAGQARDEFIGGMAAFGETAHGTITTRALHGGAGFGCELGRFVSARTGVAVRVGTVSMTGESARFEGSGPFGENYLETWAFDHSLTVIMVGLWQEGGDPDRLSWRGGVFIGPAYADSSFAMAGRYVDPLEPSTNFSWDGRGRFTGNTLAGEVGGRAVLRVGEGWSVFAEAGYLAADVKEMRSRSDVDVDGNGTVDYHRGNILLSGQTAPGARPSDRRPLAFDFSGLALRAGVTVRFAGASASAAAHDREAWGD
jgi:hypothetical protein